jgi:hypothetical protein
MELCKFISPTNINETINFDILLLKNERPIKIITMSDDKYIDLCIDLIESIQSNDNNKIHTIIVYDVGLSKNNIEKIKSYNKVLIKTIDRNKNIYITKTIVIYKEFNILNENEIMFFMDSACKILGSLDKLINYVYNYDFFAGVTNTPVLHWLSFNNSSMKFYNDNINNDSNNNINYNTEYRNHSLVGIETGFLGFKKNKEWLIDYVNTLYNLTISNSIIFDTFPEEQKIAALLLHNFVYKKYRNLNIILYNSPNIRHKWICNKEKIVYKDHYQYNPDISVMPFFEYCYHNHIDSNSVPPSRNIKNMNK